MSWSRRRFLNTSLASSTLVTMGSATIPGFLSRSAVAARASKDSERILVVVQLLGGNDGLNTVVPHGIGGYERGRRVLRIPAGQVHKVTKEIGLHPSMGGMARLLGRGRLAIVQGVGYPNPDRSHFRSMEIWESARQDNDAKALETGWLGRMLDSTPPKPGADPAGLHIGGRSMPLAMRTKKIEVSSIEGLESYQLQLGGTEADKKAERGALSELAGMERRGDDPLLGFISRTTLSAYESSSRLEQLLNKKQGGPTYPNFGLARRLELIAKIIKAGFSTRIFYTSLDGFDTHANQLGTHAALLLELSDSIAAFDDDLTAAGLANRVALITFSEFGRRVQENASLGTDHGAAAPMFFVGPTAKPGLVGEHPSLEDLDEGDLKSHTDFRRVYSTIVSDWLRCPVEPIVGKKYERIPSLVRV